MIDPNNIINYNRTDEELEELLLFLIAVAGKNAATTAKNLTCFLWNSTAPTMHERMYQRGSSYPPFAWIKRLDELTSLKYHIQQNSFGCYNRLERGFREAANSGLDLRTCTKEDLMKIHGVGRKSASCFLAWTRRGEKVAMLDTHLLKYLRKIQTNYQNHPAFSELFRDLTIPKSTPSSKKLYDTLEHIYLTLCELQGLDPTEFDLEIWRHYANKLDKAKQSGTI